MKKWLLGLFLILWTSLILIWRAQDFSLIAMQIRGFMVDQGSTGLVIFGVIYILATIFLLPCSILSFIAGMVYGFWGLPIVLFFASLGASISFYISRTLAQKRVNELVEKRALTKAIKEAIAIEGWKFLILLRLSPIVPFNINNYFLGTVPVRYFTYLWVTVVGLLPTSLLYIYLGALEKSWSEQKELKLTLLSLGLIATIVMLWMTAKKTRAILSQQKGV